jgi:hypothetical protein
MIRSMQDRQLLEDAIVLKAMREVEQAIAKATVSIAILRAVSGDSK